MRIRKRFPTIPSSPPSPPLAPSSPPHPHISSIADSLHHHVDEEEALPPAPPALTAPTALSNPPVIEEHVEPPPSRSDLQLILVKGSNGWVCKTDDDCMHQLNKEESSSLDANTIHFSLSSMGSFGAKDGHGIIASTQQDGDDENTMVEGAMKKKRKKADKDSVMTEGARCSRVNGRGWRCCQPTLVGYSLCEHHTSKGRIRSSAVTSCIDKAEENVGGSLSLSPSSAPVPSASASPSPSPSPSPSLSLSGSPSSSPISVNEEPLMKTIMKRKKKGGMGKARSISSILGQTQPQFAPPLPIHTVDSVTGL